MVLTSDQSIVSCQPAPSRLQKSVMHFASRQAGVASVCVYGARARARVRGSARTDEWASASHDPDRLIRGSCERISPAGKAGPKKSTDGETY